MSARLFVYASVCTAFLAASAAVAGTPAATSNPQLVSQAYKALQAGDADSAIAAYTQAIESRELEAEVLANALLNRGLAHQRRGDHAKSIDDYTAALRIDAMSGKLRAVALYNRGLSFQKIEKQSRAIEDFTSALFLDGRFAHAYMGRGVSLRDSGQILFALADFSKALKFNHPDAARVHYAEAIAYEKLDRIDDARNALNKAIAADPKFAPAAEKLATLGNVGVSIVQVSPNADDMTTASIGGTTTASKEVLPAAEEPPKALGENIAAVKKITDRVPMEDSLFDAPPPAQSETVVASAETVQEQQAVVSDAVAEPEERVVAIEAVADEPAPGESAGNENAAEETENRADAQATSPWSVQVASATSENAAWSTWKKMQARHNVLKGKEPVVVKADLGTKGIFYRVRLVGFDNQGEAKSACSKLKSGGVKCYVSKTDS